LPRTLSSDAWKLSASHGTDTANLAASLRGWNTGAPQTAGMWFQIELAQPTLVSEVMFDSPGTGRGGGGGGGRGAAPGAPGAPGAPPAGAPAPAAGAPAPAAPAAGAAVTAGAPPAGAQAPGAPGAPGGGRGAAGGGFGGGGFAAPAAGFPRGYSITTSLDGKTWSKPVAVGKGAGQRTDITFAPTRAKFVRITQTDTVADAPAWSIQNLRLWETPAPVK
jgi:hypothetical protein